MVSPPPEPLGVRETSRAGFPSLYGEFHIHGFEHLASGEAYVVLSRGEPGPAGPVPLVRIHSQCLTGDTLGSLRCDCGQQLHAALERIHGSGCGLLIYHPQEGRGIGILNKLSAYALQDRGADTVEANEMLGFDADEREYGACAEILRWFGVGGIRLMSNNPAKIEAMEKAGIRVVERVPLQVEPVETARAYLQTKKEKMGHLLEEV